MIPCRRYAVFTLMRDAGFFGIAAFTLMVAFSFEPALAFKIGATVVLLFALLMLARSYLLTDESFQQSEIWRSLRPEERPAGERGLQVARATLQELMLHFAKTAAGVACVMYCGALVLAAASGSHDTIVSAELAQLR